MDYVLVHGRSPYPFQLSPGPQVNAMRNRALANAHTDAVLLLDVDFWPSAGALACRAGKATLVGLVCGMV